MRIEKLELNGFKSFADRTSFAIHPGITCIVGPNGSGKSNIVDALRWVLGEQSAKTLRGGKMEEVIFNGSQSKKPKGMAEVILYLKLPDDSGNGESADRIITVGRRLYRSGESEYLINKKPCRLKDIREMFLDTGLEMRSYSIIEQGRIGEIINAKPQDRRFLIEEVAGIMKYKVRKAEAQNKLENSRMNLQRISDILKEVKRQRNSLDRQAKKAERYKKLKEELKELEIRLSRHEYLELNEKLHNINSEVEQLSNKDAALRNQISQRESAVEAKRLEIINKEKEIDALQVQLTEAENRISELERKKAVDDRDILHLEGLIDSLKRQYSGIDTSTEQKSAVIEELLIKLKELDKEISQAKEELHRKTESLKENEGQIKEKEQEIESKRRELFSLSDHIGQIKNELHRLELTLENNNKRITSAERELQETIRRQEELQEELDRLEESVQATTASIEQKRQSRDALSLKLSEKRKEIEALRNKRLEFREEIVSAESRIASLKEMLSGSTEVTALKETGISPVATVSELIEVEERYERAVEAALEEKLKGMVFSDRDALLRAVEAVKRNKMPRLSLLMTGMSGNSTSQDCPSDTIRLSEVVKVSPPAEDIIKTLLERYLLVETVTTALELVNDGQVSIKGYRFVTPSGEVVEYPGVVTCGSGSDILKKRREIREIEDLIASKNREIDHIDQKISTLTSEVEDIKNSLKEIEAQIIKDEREISVKKSSINRVKDDRDRNSKKADFIRIEIENLKKEIIQADSLVAEKRLEVQTQSERRQELENDIQVLQDELSDMKSELDVKRELLTEFRIRYNSLQDKQRNLKRQIEENRRDIENSKNKKERLKREIQHNEQRISQLKEELKGIEDELKTLVIQAGELRGQIRRKRDLLEELKAGQHTAQDELAELRKELDAVSKQLHEKDLLQTELSIRLRNLIENIKDRYQVDIKSDDLPVSTDVQADKAQAEMLREKTAAMGEVNLAALDEFKRLNERYEFLKTQHDDIIQSIEELEEAIARINQTTRKRLREAFDNLNQKLSEVFKTLFGGGSAELRLTDESNILESGIDIIAQPPGKRLQNINLLSGGEKALTALALLFAGFLLKPTPLCILDEADAPLDETNVVTFREMVRELSKNIQFLVITHNRQTMEVADYLYGITMEEAGVSKVLSLQFEEVAA